MTLIFASNNGHKIEEAEAILGASVGLLTLRKVGITDDIPETQPTIEGNALQKARYVFERTGKDCFADDTGLEVASLGGEPGVRSARYAGEGHDFKANVALLLKNMEGSDNRRAQFRTVVALIMEGKERLFEGIIEGRITLQPIGTGGFGYDSVFIPDGYTETFAQLPSEVKNAISHRAIAMQKLASHLIMVND